MDEHHQGISQPGALRGHPGLLLRLRRRRPVRTERRPLPRGDGPVAARRGLPRRHAVAVRLAAAHPVRGVGGHHRRAQTLPGADDDGARRHGRADRRRPALLPRPPRRPLPAAAGAGSALRLRHRHLLGRHRPGVLLVPAEAPGRRAGHLRRPRQPRPGPVLVPHPGGARLDRPRRLATLPGPSSSPSARSSTSPSGATPGTSSSSPPGASRPPPAARPPATARSCSRRPASRTA